MARPAFKLKDGLIVATIWENTTNEGRIFHSVSISRSYQDGNGAWKETASFTGADALRAGNLLQQAYNWTLSAKDRGEGGAGFGGGGDAANGGDILTNDDEIPF